MLKLPFGVLPGHWGLAGKTREIAKAEYELSGYDLDMKLLEILKDDLSEDDYSRKLYGIELKYNKISSQEHLRKLAHLIKDEKQRMLAMVELDLADGVISDLEYNKKVATIKGEPWITVVNMDFTKGKSTEGSFELDWNEYFVAKLKAEGYSAATTEALVGQWFMEVCRNIALEEFDGTGNFTADSEANLETFKRWNAPEPIGEHRKGYK